ncbi:hypothetical protein M3P21_04310 [Ruegeria sp. 2012CJ41-6]|uniref:Uncharacterized protein n=1 Tax=Ruegeria spongiae TaxID=2942209 RepID=A0ABT0PYP6_9RHOB|nr:hypothetical protein [Ruegeria spongiae]MCL6282746.1 hypothetical protein [Ruegeria spongiae]
MTQERYDYTAMAQEMAAGTLRPEGFSHRAHLGVAYEILSRHEVFEAMAIYAGGLRALAAAAGVPEKFNATVTFAYLSLIAERMAQASHASSEAFLTQNPDLLGKGLLDGYFSLDALSSPLARRVPLLPGTARAGLH